MSVELSVLNRVDGSCSVKSETVDVVSSVAGPMEAKLRQELPQQVALEILVVPPTGPTSTKEKAIEDKLDKILKKTINLYHYPGQLIQVVSQVLRFDNIVNKELEYIVNSVYLALIDSGISLKTSFLATSCVLLESGDLKFDYNADEYKSSSGSFFIVYALKDGKCDELIFFDSNALSLTPELINKVLVTSQQHLNAKNTEIRKTLQQKIENDYIWKI